MKRTKTSSSIINGCKRKMAVLMMCAAMLYTHDASAQSNKTYQILPGGVYESSTAKHMIDDGGGNSCILANSASADIIIKKIGFNGAWISDWGYKCPVTDATVMPTRMIKTPTGEYIVVGWYHEGPYPAPLVAYNPFAARFDALGNFMWFNVYPSNTVDISMAMPTAFNMVSIVLAESDPTTETYIITAPGHPTNIAVTGQLNIATNALRIDAMGNPMWNKKYILNTYPSVGDHRDYPQALTWMNGINEYFIGGSYQSFGAYSFGWNNFRIGINDTGNVVHQYKEFYAGGGPCLHDAIYDATTNEVVMSYTAGNTGFSAFGAYQAMVAKFDNALNITGSAYYGFQDAYENYAVSIKKNLTDDAYIIGGMNYDQVAVPYPGALSQSILKIPKTLAAPIYYNRYNVLRNVWASYLICHFDISGLTENYALASTVQMGGTNTDIRAIGVDPVLGDDWCSTRTFPVYSGTLSPSLYGDTYTDVSYNPPPLPRSLNPVSVSAYDDDCSTYAGGPDAYRTTQPWLNSGMRMPFSVYPNVLSATDNKVNFNAYTEVATDITVKLFTMEGKELASTTLATAEGQNILSWDMPLIVPGNYIIKTISNDKALNSITRITKI